MSGRNTMKILKVLSRSGGEIFGTNSGSWFPTGTQLPEPRVEFELLTLSVQIFNCTCNTWTVRNMVKAGYLEPTDKPNTFRMTDFGRQIVNKENI
ncbi:MAG: hypothetical protein CR997_07420 [Acidobacteria bacterium]|nr:MAG: hypothetical protein CR997_07420 [Acidobacteriota bacterium]